MNESDTKLLDALSRDELIARARELSIDRPELMTRVELRDEIIRLSETDDEQRKRARGWLGVARDMVASVVEQRLNLPDAAELIRGTNLRMPKHVPPVATVTLAEIYAAQGHLSRAIKLLDEVLLREPDHAAAATLRQSLVEQQANQSSEPVVRHSDVPEAPGSGWSTSEVEIEWPRSGAEQSMGPDESRSGEGEALAASETLVPSSEVRVSPSLAEIAAACIAEQIAPAGFAQEVELPAADDVDEAVVDASEDDFTSEDAPASVTVSESMIPDPEVEMEEAPARAPEPAHEQLELLLYRRVASDIACHWSINDDTWDDWLARLDGQWVIRILEVGTDGPFECDESDLMLPGTTGEVLCHDVDPTAQVRMAIGWKTAEAFHPVLIGIEIAGDEPDRLQVAWQPLPGLDDPAPEAWLRSARDCWHALSLGDV